MLLQNNEMVAMLVFQTNPEGELSSYVNTFFVPIDAGHIDIAMPGPPGWALSHGLMSHPRKKDIISETRHSFQDSRLRIVEALCITECKEARQVGDGRGFLTIQRMPYPK